jgi:hypothetical protein
MTGDYDKEEEVTTEFGQGAAMAMVAICNTIEIEEYDTDSDSDGDGEDVNGLRRHQLWAHKELAAIVD